MDIGQLSMYQLYLNENEGICDCRRIEGKDGDLKYFFFVYIVEILEQNFEKGSSKI